MRSALYYIFIFCLLFSSQVKAQGLDENYFLAGIDYGNLPKVESRLSYSVDQVYTAPYASFISKYGFDITAFASYITNIDDNLENPAYSFSLGAGYYKAFGEAFSIYAGYSKIFYDKSYNSAYSIYSDALTSSLSFDFEWVGFATTWSYYFGEENAPFLLFQNYYTIDLNRNKDAKIMVSILPDLGLNFGKQRYWTVEKMDWRTIFKMRLQNPDFKITDLISQEEKFNANSIDLYIPISLMIKDFSIEMGATAIYLLNKPQNVESDYYWYYSVGVSYMFGF